MRRLLSAVAVTVLVAGSLGSCSSATDSGQSVVLNDIQISGSTASLVPDDSVDLEAQGHYSDGSTKALTDSVTWSSSDAAAVSISNTEGTKGRAKAVGSGPATITAAYGGKTGSTTVTALAVSSISIAPASVSVDVGGTQQFTAVATFSGTSASTDVTAKATWTSSNTSAVTIAGGATTATATAVGPGSTTISAAWKGATGQTTMNSVGVASVTVTVPGGAGGYFPIGGTRSAVAMAQMSDNTQRDVTASATWASSTPAITISNTGTSQVTLTRADDDSSYVSATYRGLSGSVLLRKSCVVLANNLTFGITGGIGTADMKLDGSTLVWFDYDDAQPGAGGAFRSVSTSGGSVTTIKTGVPFAGQWALDAQYIYWMYVTTEGDQSYRIVRMSRANGAIDSLFVSTGLGGGARGIAVDGSYIYYSPGNEGGVRRMPKGGGAHTSFFAGSTFAPRWISLDGGVVYGVDVDNAPVVARRVPLDGSAMDTLANANSSFFSLVNSGYFYWSENLSQSSRIARVPVAGGASNTVATGGYMYGFAVVDGYAYYGASNQIATGLFRQSLGGGSPELVTDACGYAEGTPANPQYIATDGTYMYMSDNGGAAGHGRILRVKK